MSEGVRRWNYTRTGVNNIPPGPLTTRNSRRVLTVSVRRRSRTAVGSPGGSVGGRPRPGWRGPSRPATVENHRLVHPLSSRDRSRDDGGSPSQLSIRSGVRSDDSDGREGVPTRPIDAGRGSRPAAGYENTDSIFHEGTAKYGRRRSGKSSCTSVPARYSVSFVRASGWIRERSLSITESSGEN